MLQISTGQICLAISHAVIYLIIIMITPKLWRGNILHATSKLLRYSNTINIMIFHICLHPLHIFVLLLLLHVERVLNNIYWYIHQNTQMLDFFLFLFFTIQWFLVYSVLCSHYQQSDFRISSYPRKCPLISRSQFSFSPKLSLPQIWATTNIISVSIVER